MMKDSEDYRIQNGCHNCVHGFRTEDYDCPDGYFCTHRAPPRPPCMIPLMGPGEYPFDDIGDDEARADALRAWWEWSEKHEVDRAGICPVFELKVRDALAVEAEKGKL